jgi:hypothetical protein
MRTSPRLLTGCALLVLFMAAMGIAGKVWVDGSKERIVRVSDGRAISVGTSWPGSLDDCVTDPEINILPNCYREPVDRGSFIKQPWSTWSTLGFCLVGLFILARADRTKSTSDTWLGFVALFMGPGSALFHGTLTSWGGWGDVLSMYALLAFIVGWEISVLRHQRDRLGRWFWLLFGVSIVLKAISGALTTIVFIAFGVGTGVFVLASWTKLLGPAGFRRSGARLGLAFALLGLAIVPWLLSNPFAGDPVDVPFHAAWHLLSAAFVLSYWWYLQSERAVQVSQPAEEGRQEPWPVTPTSPSSV